MVVVVMIWRVIGYAGSAQNVMQVNALPVKIIPTWQHLMTLLSQVLCNLTLWIWMIEEFTLFRISKVASLLLTMLILGGNLLGFSFWLS
jgi:hypothetical protein